MCMRWSCTSSLQNENAVSFLFHHHKNDARFYQVTVFILQSHVQNHDYLHILQSVGKVKLLLGHSWNHARLMLILGKKSMAVGFTFSVK